MRDNFDAEMAWATDNDIGFVTEDFAEPEIVAMFVDVYEIQTLETKELTDYQEKEVKFWEWLLNHYGVDGFHLGAP